MRRKWLCLIVVACACLFLATTVRVDASTYGKLQQAQREKDQAEKKAEQVQGDLGDLNEERAGLQTYLDQLNDELLQTSSELAGIEDLITQKENALVEKQKELETAKEREAEQYDAMKKRIKFMYERGDSAYLELFFNAESFADFLNKTEYVERMSQYDREMLEEYMTIQETIQNIKI